MSALCTPGKRKMVWPSSADGGLGTVHFAFRIEIGLPLLLIQNASTIHPLPYVGDATGPSIAAWTPVPPFAVNDPLLSIRLLPWWILQMPFRISIASSSKTRLMTCVGRYPPGVSTRSTVMVHLYNKGETHGPPLPTCVGNELSVPRSGDD